MMKLRGFVGALVVAGATVFAADAALAKEVNEKRQSSTTDAAKSASLALEKGTFIDPGDGKPPIICIKPKFLRPIVVGKVRLPGKKRRPVVSPHFTKVKSQVKALRGLAEQLAKHPNLRQQIIGKLKNLEKALEGLGQFPCGELPHVLMGTSARCQGSSGEP